MTLDQLLNMFPKKTHVIINRGAHPKMIKDVQRNKKDYIIIQDKEIIDLDVDSFMDDFGLQKPYVFIRTKRGA